MQSSFVASGGEPDPADGGARFLNAAVTASTLLLPLPPSINWLRQLQGMGPDKLDPLGRYLLRLAATANLCSYLPLRAIVERRAYATYINGACTEPEAGQEMRSALVQPGPNPVDVTAHALPAAWWARRKGVAAMLAQKPRSWDAVGCGCMPGPVLPRACVAAAAGDMPRQIPGLLQQTRTGRHGGVSQPVAIRALAPKTARQTDGPTDTGRYSPSVPGHSPAQATCIFRAFLDLRHTVTKRAKYRVRTYQCMQNICLRRRAYRAAYLQHAGTTHMRSVEKWNEAKWFVRAQLALPSPARCVTPCLVGCPGTPLAWPATQRAADPHFRGRPERTRSARPTVVVPFHGGDGTDRAHALSLEPPSVSNGFAPGTAKFRHAHITDKVSRTTLVTGRMNCVEHGSTKAADRKSLNCRRYPTYAPSGYAIYRGWLTLPDGLVAVAERAVRQDGACLGYRAHHTGEAPPMQAGPAPALRLHPMALRAPLPVVPLGHRLRGRRPLSPRSDQEAREEKEEAGPNGRRRAGLPLFDLTWPSTVRQGPTKYFGRIATLRRRSFPPAVRLLPPHCSLPALRGFPSAGRRHHILARLQPLAHCVSQNQVARDTGRCKQGGLRLPPPANDPPELRQAWAQFASPRSSRAGFGSKVTITIEPGVHKDRAPSQLPSAALTSTGGTQGAEWSRYLALRAAIYWRAAAPDTADTSLVQLHVRLDKLVVLPTCGQQLTRLLVTRTSYMAVVRARNIHAKQEIWEHGCNNALILPSEPLSTLNMSYQYIAPPPHDPAMEYSPAFRIMPQDSSAPEGDGRDSEGSYDDNPGSALRRSFSTPNASQMQQGTSGAQMSTGGTGEKKRNKLGYHRTSIACNCGQVIAAVAKFDVLPPLKSRTGGESRSRGAVRQTAGSSVASSTSSPAVAGGSPGEMAGMIQSNKGQTTTDDYLPADVKEVPSNGLPAGGHYGFGSQAPGMWMSPDSNGAPLVKAEGLNMTWTPYPAESPLSAQFSPFPQSSGSSAPWAPGSSEAGSHDDMAWSEFPQPARSMSYSGESTAGQQQLQYLATGDGQQFERRASNFSGIYGQPFGPSAANMTSSGIAGLDGHDTILAGAVPSDADSWHQQNVLAQDSAQFRGWQYGKATGNQQVWLDEQRQQTVVTQAPSDSYYSA
ncbi:hypothetical protein PCL_04805 [Purpureocillium lilacinum]|uniref:Uncharacterized protein n=1 Tax=Purpureocillium lilacinum TaxID=33203 RepID=A0A2U3DWP6_PURLI|nr:hypothetical protein PCL_04805 [Purpureocillium lilacinum]